MDLAISAGYTAGAIGAVVNLHGSYYAEHWGFGLFFEAKVARELSEFLLRYDQQRDCFLIAKSKSRIVGSITLDGSDPEAPQGITHLRWFIVAKEAQGLGVGRTLLGESLRFARAAGFLGVYLWTFEGLHGARKLYEETGFGLVEQRAGEMWGSRVTEQRYVLKF